MNPKNLSIIAYLTLIGWTLSYFSFSKGTKNPLLQYHLKQSLGLIILCVLFSIAIKIIAILSSTLAGILSWAGVFIIILLVFGIINALNEVRRPIPFIGRYFETRFSFIK